MFKFLVANLYFQITSRIKNKNCVSNLHYFVESNRNHIKRDYNYGCRTISFGEIRYAVSRRDRHGSASASVRFVATLMRHT